MSNLQTVADQILEARDSIPSHQSVLTAITGVDGCGKGDVTAQIVNAIQAKGVRATGINNPEAAATMMMNNDPKLGPVH